MLLLRWRRDTLTLPTEMSFFEEERYNLMEELSKLNIKQVTIRPLLTNQLTTSFFL